MEFFKNLSHLEDKYKLIKESNTYIEVRFNSADKKVIKEFQNEFFSLNFKESKEEPNVLVSCHIDSHILSLFSSYINTIAQSNNTCLHLSSYTEAQLKQLKFKDYLYHFNSCFIYHANQAFYSNPENAEDQRIMREITTGEKIFNSPFAKDTYPQELYEGLSNDLTNAFHLDYLMETHLNTQSKAPVKSTIKKIGNNALDDIVYQVATVIQQLIQEDCITEFLFGYPPDMLRHYISTPKGNLNNQFQVVSSIIELAINQNYKVTNNFFPLEETEFKSLNNLKEIDHFASTRVFGNGNFYDKFYLSSDFAENATNNFNELISNIVTYIWTGLSLHYSFKHLSKAFHKAKKENKTLFELSSSKNYINNPKTIGLKFESLLAILNISPDTLPEYIQENIQDETYDSKDLQDNDDTPIDFHENELNDIE